MGMSDTVNATTMIRECISIVEKELGINLMNWVYTAQGL